VTGYASFFGAARSLLSPTTDIQFSDHLTWLKGDHSVKVGGLVVRNRKDQNGRSLYAGDLRFDTSGNSRTTGNAFADALLGNFRTYSEAQADPMGFFRFWQAEGFVSDDWRVSAQPEHRGGRAGTRGISPCTPRPTTWLASTPPATTRPAPSP